MRMEYAFRTDVGKVRTHNEDDGGVFVKDEGLLAVVADGMGGHLAGDVASSMTTSFLKEAWEKKRRPGIRICCRNVAGAAI